MNQLAFPYSFIFLYEFIILCIVYLQLWKFVKLVDINNEVACVYKSNIFTTSILNFFLHYKSAILKRLVCTFLSIFKLFLGLFLNCLCIYLIYSLRTNEIFFMSIEEKVVNFNCIKIIENLLFDLWKKNCIKMIVISPFFFSFWLNKWMKCQLNSFSHLFHFL